MLERLYIGNMPMVHTETVKVSADEKKLLERLRNADSDIQKLFFITQKIRYLHHTHDVLKCFMKGGLNIGK